MNGRIINGRAWLFLAVVVILAITGLSSVTSASTIAGSKIQSIGGADARKAQDKDGFDQLPRGYKAMSMSSLVSSRRVHPQAVAPIGQAVPRRYPYAPKVTVNWGPEQCTSCPTDANEPAASMHPTDPLFALVSGNFTVDRTTNGGTSWTTQNPVWPSGSGDVVNAWLPTSANQDWALGSSLNGSPVCLTEGRTTNRGATWTTVSSNICTTGFFNDRHYLFADQEPTSPFYGRVYLSQTLFDSAGSGSYNAVGLRFTSDMGNTWSNMVVQQSGAIAGTEGDRQFGSVAFQNGGNIIEGWMNAICCGGNPTLGGNFNKYHWARSTDGGVTFPVTGTIANDTRNESVAFNATSPAGFRWSPQLDVGADPVDGTLYAVWLKFRTPGTPQGSGAAVAFARSTNNGASWSAPTFVYNDPNAAVTQYMPWVIASRDHSVHVHYSSSQPGSPTTLAHYYVQSTDQGATWTAPFQMSGVTYTASGFMGDYQAIHVGAYNGSNASIISSWTDNRSAQRRHFARVGTLVIGTPTPTFTGTPPTATNTNTPTNTPTSTNTPTNTPTPTVTPTFATCGTGSNYAITSSTGATLVPGTTDIGNHCDDCTTTIALPFAYNLYGKPFSSANVGSNGTFQFVSNSLAFSNGCLPDATFNTTIFAFWDDLYTLDAANGQGIFTSVSGSAPNRIFNIEWRTTYCCTGGVPINDFELRLYEGQDRFDIVYGTPMSDRGSATIGVQNDTGPQVTIYECNVAGPTSGLQLTFTELPCGSPTPTFTPATTPPPPTPTFTPTRTFTPAPTFTPTSTFTPTRTPTSLPPDFSISVSPSSRTVIRPGTVTYTVTLTSLNGFSGNVSLSVSGLPSKTTASFNPPVVSLIPGGNGNSTLTVTADRGGNRGTFTLTITGTSGAISHSQNVTLVITR